LTFGPPLGVFGVGHEVQSLPDVRRPEARSAGIERPDGVALCFQVSVNSVEPSKSVLARNLLAKESARAALADEAGDLGPQVALVLDASALPGRAEGLAGAACGPDWLGIRPSGEAQGVAPDPDAGEEVALGESGKVAWLDIYDAPLVNLPVSNEPDGNEIAQPLRRERINLVVVGGHWKKP
jgi:hypothetical protein